MKKIFICLLLIFSFGKIYAQDINFEYSKESGVPGSMTLCDNSKNLFVISPYRQFQTSQFISKFGITTLKFIFLPQEIKSPKINGKKTEYDRLIVIKDKCYLFILQPDKELKKTMDIYATPLKSDGTLSNEYVLINQFFNHNHFTQKYALSSDNTKLLSYSFGKSYKTIMCKLLDSDLKTIWAKEITLPENGSHYGYQVKFVDNDGNIYFVSNGSNKKGAKPSKTSYELVKYDYTNNNFKEIDISDGSNYLSEVTIRLNKNNDIICGGFYSLKKLEIHKLLLNDNEVNYPDGFFLTIIDKDSLRVNKFGHLNMVKNNSSEAIRNLNLDNLIIKENGDFILSAESKFFFTDQYNATTYFFENISIGYFDSEANPIWYKNIPKCQSSFEPYLSLKEPFSDYCSYAILINKEDVKVLFNDTEKNFRGNPVGVKPNCMYTYDMMLTVISIDKYGSATTDKHDYLSLLNKTKEELGTMAYQNNYRNYIQLKDNQLFILNNKPAKITFAK